MLKKFLGVLIVLGSCITCITQAYTTTEYNNSAIITFEANEEFKFLEQTQEVKNNFTFEYNGYNVFAISYPSTDVGASLFFQNGIPTEIATSKIANGFYGNQAFNFKYVCTINTGNTTTIYQKCYIPSQTNFPNQTNYDTERSTFITENKTQTVKNYIFISTQNTQNINFNAGTLCAILTNDKTVCFQLRQGIYTRGNEDTGANFTENFCRGYKHNGIYKSSQEIYSRGCEYIIPTFNDFEYYSGSIDNESPFNGQSNNTTNTPCITIGQLINMGGSDYNTGMCYTDSRYWSGNATTGEYIYITPQSIFTLYPTYTELREDMNIYNNYCNNYVTTQQACITAFSGSKGLNITLLDKLKGKNSTRLNTLYDYCKTREVYSGSLDTSTCDLTDEDIKNIVPSMLTPEGQAENAMQQGITTTNPKEGSVFDGLTDETARDLFETIPRVYQKITGIFNDRSGVNGIIPDYITRILLAIILFAIFKK